MHSFENIKSYGQEVDLSKYTADLTIYRLDQPFSDPQFKANQRPRAGSTSSSKGMLESIVKWSYSVEGKKSDPKKSIFLRAVLRGNQGTEEELSCFPSHVPSWEF